MQPKSKWIVVCSETGNTLTVAQEIAKRDPSTTLIQLGKDELPNIKAGDIVVLAFWNDRGMVPVLMQQFVRTLQQCDLYCVMTLGGDPTNTRSQAWAKTISMSVSQLGNDCSLLGYTMCQGRMSRSIYERMAEKSNEEQLERLNHAYEASLPHPNDEDIEHIWADYQSAFFAQ